jgi:hypothetical protein
MHVIDIQARELSRECKHCENWEANLLTFRTSLHQSEVKYYQVYNLVDICLSSVWIIGLCMVEIYPNFEIIKGLTVLPIYHNS